MQLGKAKVYRSKDQKVAEVKRHLTVGKLGDFIKNKVPLRETAKC
jgi:hypothetical protein